MAITTTIVVVTGGASGCRATGHEDLVLLHEARGRGALGRLMDRPAASRQQVARAGPRQLIGVVLGAHELLDAGGRGRGLRRTGIVVGGLPRVVQSGNFVAVVMRGSRGVLILRGGRWLLVVRVMVVMMVVIMVVRVAAMHAK